MSNPAREAQRILERWRAQASEAQLNGVSVSLSQIRAQSEIVRLARALAEVEALLGQLEREGRSVAAYRRQIPDWWGGLVSPNHREDQAISPDGVISQEHLDEIEACATVLDFYVLSMSTDQTENLRSIVARARVLLAEDVDLSNELRVYLHRLLQQVEQALDDDALGATFNFAEAVIRLRVAFKAAEGERTKKSATWNTLWTSFVSASASAGLIEGGTILIKALTS